MTNKDLSRYFGNILREQLQDMLGESYGTKGKKWDKKTERWVKAVLSNDENSTDEELHKHFTDNGLSHEDAKHWVGQRDKYMGKIVPTNEATTPKMSKVANQMGATKQECGSCGADIGPSPSYPWHHKHEDCRAIKEPIKEEELGEATTDNFGNRYTSPKHVIRKGSLTKDEYLQKDGSFGPHKTARRFASADAADRHGEKHLQHLGHSWGTFEVSVPRRMK